MERPQDGMPSGTMRVSCFSGENGGIRDMVYCVDPKDAKRKKGVVSACFVQEFLNSLKEWDHVYGVSLAGVNIEDARRALHHFALKHDLEHSEMLAPGYLYQVDLRTSAGGVSNE